MINFQPELELNPIEIGLEQETAGCLGPLGCSRWGCQTFERQSPVSPSHPGVKCKTDSTQQRLLWVSALDLGDGKKPSFPLCLSQEDRSPAQPGLQRPPGRPVPAKDSHSSAGKQAAAPRSVVFSFKMPQITDL